MPDAVAGQPKLGPRFHAAFDYAATLHHSQLRKGTDVPYLAHLMGVCALVLEDGGDEDQAIAALLHDAVEDQGGQPVLDEIRARFGDRVAEIVLGCTDALPAPGEPKAPWRPRKEAYLAHLRAAGPEVRRVSLADKLHNARAILQDFRTHGDALWTRFTADFDGQRWYYRQLAEIHGATPSPLAAELARTIAELERLATAPRRA
jgi:(p)ppGpp synthase/HD superfamily hydrolase